MDIRSTLQSIAGAGGRTPAHAAARAMLLVSLCLLGPGCVYISRHTLRGACLNDLSSPVRNFCVVEPHILWRGERPTRDDAQWLLAQLGESYMHTVSYFQVSGFSPFQVLSPSHLDKHVARFLAIVKAAPKPVYVHCRAGVDRTGVLAAAYRVVIDGASRKEAIAEMARYHSPWQSLDARYISGLSEARRQEILREAAEWQARVRPTASLECVRGRCTYVRNVAAAGESD